ncbi:MAG: PASTA domain-containing protein [Methylotenera sp.]|nr:PASTA domain-containing protein [Oligoflexia bacterium]
MKQRITVIMVGCLLLATGVMSRAAYIQLIGDPKLNGMAKRQFSSRVLVKPRRGLVLDRNGEPLAINLEVQSLAANPSKIQNKKTMARLLAKATGLPYSKIYNRLKDPKREFVWIKRHIQDQELERFKKWQIIDPSGDLMSGLWMVKESERAYPHGELAAHVLGNVNLDTEGVEGVELWGNEQLQGKVVSVAAIRDALGRPTFMDAVAAKDAKDGESITLTLDSSLQFSVEQELKHAVTKSNAKAGSVIVMDATTGEILAMANEPSFNPNNRGAPLDHRRNRVLTDGYEPGSIMKPFLVASALSNGWKLTDTVYGEKGSFYVQGKKISEAEAKEKFEWINLKKVIQVSSNVGAAKIALKLGADKYLATLKALEIGSKSGIGFPGEISGRIPPRKSWTPLTLANIGFGQGVLVTPIQMLRGYAALANGGWLVQPTLLKSSFSKFTPTPPVRVFTQQVADGVTQAMELVTQEGGTAKKAALDGYVVAGKTGTAQMVDPATGGYSRSKHISSFIGYPVGVEPRLVIFTQIAEPQGIYFAGETAAPLFHAVLNAAATRFSIPSASDGSRTLASVNAPTRMAKSLSKITGKKEAPAAMRTISLEELDSNDNIRWSAAETQNPVQMESTTPGGATSWKMPGLLGLTAREALRSLQGHKFQIALHGAGIIQSQSPEEGKEIADGSTVRLQMAEPL